MARLFVCVSVFEKNTINFVINTNIQRNDSCKGKECTLEEGSRNKISYFVVAMKKKTKQNRLYVSILHICIANQSTKSLKANRCVNCWTAQWEAATSLRIKKKKDIYKACHLSSFFWLWLMLALNYLSTVCLYSTGGDLKGGERDSAWLSFLTDGKKWVTL